jgi:5-formyltetrahydrofolate cyclo-ligase
VAIFWFNTTDVPDSASLTPLVAYDKNGNRLTK